VVAGKPDRKNFEFISPGTKRVTALLINSTVGTRRRNDWTMQVKHCRSNQTQGRIKMLVLSRKVGEKLVIDGNITVEVVKVQGNRITLGIAAPSEVKVLRGELTQPKASPKTVEIVVQDGLLVA
jgi:carbon storage regulator